MSEDHGFLGQSLPAESGHLAEMGPVLEAETDSQLDHQDTSNVSVSSISSLIIHTRPPTPSSVDSAEENDDEDNAPATIHTAIRTLKRPQVVYLRPAVLGAQTLKSASARIVSLPETVSKYSAKQEASRRVVSMPQREPIHLSPYMDASDHFGLEGSPARVRVRSVATDMPHTPSPPSSPDSVEFIANRSPLPDGFLRKNAGVARAHTPEPRENQGWISWTRSPPRPIPALHGPLSLPYARCPSGAEGTVIEEQGDLPRMIWGLDGSEDASHRQRAENESVQKQHGPQVSFKRFNRSTASQPVPPRFNNPTSRNECEYVKRVAPTPSAQHQLLTPEAEHQMLPTQPQIQAGSPEDYYALPSHGPIDLSKFLCQGADLPAPDMHTKESDFASNAAWDPLGDNLYHYGSTGAMNWQALLVAQERLRNSLATSVSGNSLGDYPRNSASSSSLASLASSRSPIILAPPAPVGRNLGFQLSPLSSQYNTPILNTSMTSHVSSRRPSAFEIAQKYKERQQASQKQQQTMLPTPPSSSSSLWSSQFSPYQESLLSPEFLPTARLPDMPLQEADRQRLALLQRAEALQQLRSAEHARFGISGRHPQGQVQYLAPASQLQGHLNETFSAPVAGNTAYRTSLGGLNLYSQQAPASGASNSMSSLMPRRAPAGPRSPTSTGFGPIGSRVPPRTPSLGSNVPDAPPTPASPQQHSRKTSQSAPRSIPLARLVQRLSSVPEEDTSAPSDKGRASSGTQEPRTMTSGHRASAERKTPASNRAFQSLNETGQARKKATPQGSSIGRPGPRGRTGGEHTCPSTETKAALATSTSQEPDPALTVGVDRGEEGSGVRETSPSRGRRNYHRGRGGGRGAWRARRTNAVNGPERSQGSLTVRS